MSILVNRRRLLKAGSSAAAAAAWSSVVGRALAQQPGDLRVAVGGGDAGRAYIEAFVKPFQAETGAKVTPLMDEAASKKWLATPRDPNAPRAQ